MKRFSWAILVLSIFLIIPLTPSVFSSEIEYYNYDPIEYSLTNAVAADYTGFNGENTFDMQIYPQGEGVLTISFPRDLFDAQLSGIDIDFVVQGLKNVGDFETIEHKEIATTETHRILSIDFPRDMALLTIIGTKIGELPIRMSEINEEQQVQNFPASGSIIVKNTDFEVDYSITYGTIHNVEGNDDNSIIFLISTINDGKLKVTLPDEFKITSNKEQNKIWTLVDAEIVDYQFVATPFRSIVIPFSDGTEEIEIYYELKIKEDETPDLIQSVMKKQQSEIPEWIQSILTWYEEDKVSEDELLNTIQYLVNEEILILQIDLEKLDEVVKPDITL